MNQLQKCAENGLCELKGEWKYDRRKNVYRN